MTSTPACTAAQCRRVSKQSLRLQSPCAEADRCFCAAAEAVQNPSAVANDQKKLVALLDAAEAQLSETAFLAGDA